MRLLKSLLQEERDSRLDGSRDTSWGKYFLWQAVCHTATDVRIHSATNTGPVSGMAAYRHEIVSHELAVAARLWTGDNHGGAGLSVAVEIVSISRTKRASKLSPLTPEYQTKP